MYYSYLISLARTIKTGVQGEFLRHKPVLLGLNETDLHGITWADTTSSFIQELVSYLRRDSYQSHELTSVIQCF